MASTAFDLAPDIHAGLTRPQKELPFSYFYDELGSALFDAITLLPEYGLTRAEARILRRHADAVAGRLRPPVRVAELGSGSGVKTRWLLEALARHSPSLAYYPIDISRAALDTCRRELAGVPGLEIHGLEHSHLDGLRVAVAARNRAERMLVLFLGSSIGNFGPAASDAFLHEIRWCLSPGDALLLGTDLVKPRETMLLAYDDPIGVTAAFNRNLLAHVNRRYNADFDPRAFDHEVRYHEREGRVEMHLRASRPQTITLASLNLTVHIRAGETIWTESSHKYRAEQIPGMARRAGFDCAGQWTDAEWPFAESLLIAE